jgi:tetrahydromethanopterin S-methyltransferase subunit B
MTIVIGNLSGNEKNKFSHIYSPENYDYIRQAILFYVINSQFKEFDKFIEAFKEVVDDAKTNIQGSVEGTKINNIMTELTPQIDNILTNDTKKIDDRKAEILKLVSSKTKDPEIEEKIKKEINEKIVDRLMNQLQPNIQSLDNNSSQDDINNKVKSLISSETDDPKIIDAAMDRYNKNLALISSVISVDRP